MNYKYSNNFYVYDPKKKRKDKKKSDVLIGSVKHMNSDNGIYGY